MTRNRNEAETDLGRRAAQLAAQAQAAHNQAIIQGLNAFTQLDPNVHRWAVSCFISHL